jgi:cytidylate kinase
MKKKIITISGQAGSGKSSTADSVAKVLGFQRFSGGDFTRKIALEMGISLNELTKKQEKDKSMDERVDEEIKKAGEMENVVIDSRLAFHWIPESFKVFLDLSPEVAKERIARDLKNNILRQQSENSHNSEEIYAKIIERLKSEIKRYKEYYGIADYTDKNNFDLVIDTNKNNLEEVVDIVVSEYKKWMEN